MIQKEWIIEKLSGYHDKQNFDCGEDSLNRYIKNLATQDQRRKASQVHVIVENDNVQVIGYYSLNSFAVELDLIEQSQKRKFAKYSQVSAAKIGRLAVDKQYQDKKIGEILLIDALERIKSISEEIGIAIVVVDALNESVIRFYERYGFTLLHDNKTILFLPVKDIP